MAYPKGTVPTNAFTASGDTTYLGHLYHRFFPNLEIPDQIPVHPTPVYETLAAFAIFAFLWMIRKRPMAAGVLFGLYLVLAGLERFLVEIIRLNPEYGTLSQAQWISIVMIVLGGLMVYKLKDKVKVA